MKSWLVLLAACGVFCAGCSGMFQAAKDVGKAWWKEEGPAIREEIKAEAKEQAKELVAYGKEEAVKYADARFQVLDEKVKAGTATTGDYVQWLLLGAAGAGGTGGGLLWWKRRNNKGKENAGKG